MLFRSTRLIQPYLTTWSSGVPTVSYYDTIVTGLAAGIYTLTVEDDNLCFASATVTVGASPAVSVSETHTDILCYGGTSIITPTVSGGDGTLTTEISGGTYTVTAGTYTITTTDTRGCSATISVTIENPPLYEYTQTETACNSYLWTVNNTSYTTSGVYTATYLSVNGCDSNYTLNLTVNYTSSSVENVTVADSYTWNANNVTYTVSGTYFTTVMNAGGCDSSLTLNLTILNISILVDQPVSCNGNMDGSLQASASGGSGNFTYDIDGGMGYSNTTGFFQNLAPGVHTVCAKESPSNVVVCGTILITQPAPITITLTVDSMESCHGNDGGITAVITGGTRIIQPYLTTWSSGVPTVGLYDTIVTGLAAGVYTLTVEDDNLCFATATVTVGSDPAVTINETHADIPCHGGSTVIIPVASGGFGVLTTEITGGTYNVTAGSYTITTTDSRGCSATTVVTLVDPPLNQFAQSETACDSYFWAVNNQTYTTSGVYTASYAGVNGCDSAYALYLTINYTTSSVTNVTAPNSYTWDANNVTYTLSGTYTVTIPNAAGCDSNLTLHLSILTLDAQLDQNVSCFNLNDGSVVSSATGGSGNFTYDIDGQNLFTNTTGSFINLSAGVHTICAKESPSNVVVCDTVTVGSLSAIVVVLTVDSLVSCHGNDGGISAVISGGDTTLQPYLTMWSGGTNTGGLFDLYTTGLSAGTYTLGVMDDNLCYIETSITVGTSPSVTVSASSTTILCNGGSSVITPVASGGDGPLTTTITGGSFTVGAGTYTITATDTRSCSSSTVITVTEPALYAYSQSETACDSYEWMQNNQTYTTSGIYTANYTSINGCDSIYTLNLTINYSTTDGNATETACDSYTWNGSTYTSTGVYTHTTINSSGCINTATLNLTVNYSSTSTESATACGSYEWPANGVIYTVSGIYTATSLNASGCIHTATLDLTINSSSFAYESFTACDSYTWNGNTYTTSGTYSYTSVNNAGCLNTVLLDLTVNYNSVSSESVTECDSYTWAANGITYTAGGTYIATSTNASGCVHTATLNLVINYSTTNGDASVTECNSYVWNSSTYTSSGIYTYTTLNNAGCVNTATLTLTINYSTTSSSSETVCDTYTWPADGMTYTTSGVYTSTSINASGCLHTSTLNLTVNYSTFDGGSTTVQCNSYTWNGSTYTVSGIYTYTTMNSGGCVNTATLDLTITYATSSTLNQVACNSFTWTNGVTYTMAGTYTYTTQNAAGCDSILTLNLTLNNGVTVAAKAMLEGAYDISTGLMKDSLRQVTHCPSMFIGVPGVCPPVNVIPPTRLNLFNNLSCSNDADTTIGGGNAVIAASIMATTGADAIVDWIFLEIRSGANFNTIVATDRKSVV